MWSASCLLRSTMKPIAATLDRDPSGANMCPGVALAAQMALCGLPPGVASMMRLVATAKLLTMILNCAGFGKTLLFCKVPCPRSSNTVASVRCSKRVQSSTHEMPCLPSSGMRTLSSVMNSLRLWMKLWCGHVVYRCCVSASCFY